MSVKGVKKWIGETEQVDTSDRVRGKKGDRCDRVKEQEVQETEAEIEIEE